MTLGVRDEIEDFFVITIGRPYRCCQKSWTMVWLSFVGMKKKRFLRWNPEIPLTIEVTTKYLELIHSESFHLTRQYLLRSSLRMQVKPFLFLTVQLREMMKKERKRKRETNWEMMKVWEASVWVSTSLTVAS